MNIEECQHIYCPHTCKCDAIKHWPHLYYKKDFIIGQDQKNVHMILNFSHEAYSKKPESYTKVPQHLVCNIYTLASLQLSKLLPFLRE